MWLSARTAKAELQRSGFLSEHADACTCAANTMTVCQHTVLLLRTMFGMPCKANQQQAAQFFCSAGPVHHTCRLLQCSWQKASRASAMLTLSRSPAGQHACAAHGTSGKWPASTAAPIDLLLVTLCHMLLLFCMVIVMHTAGGVRGHWSMSCHVASSDQANSLQAAAAVPAVKSTTGLSTIVAGQQTALH